MPERNANQSVTNALGFGPSWLNDYAKPWAIHEDGAQTLTTLASLVDLRRHVQEGLQNQAILSSAASVPTMTKADDVLPGQWVDAGDLPGHNRSIELMESARHMREAVASDDYRPYGYRAVVNNDGIALVNISGTLQRTAGSLADATSTVQTRRTLRRMREDNGIRGVLVTFYSPGGMVDGTADLADELAGLAAVKPTHGRAEDMTASAALWCLAQCTTISANRNAEVGSIGVYMVVADWFRMAENEGIKVHRIRAGEPYKGAGVPGVPITEEQLAKWQTYVERHNTMFLSAIASGRRMSIENVRKLNTGEIWVGEDAVSVGLVDHIEPFDASLARLQTAAGATNRTTAGGRAAAADTGPTQNGTITMSTANNGDNTPANTDTTPIANIAPAAKAATFSDLRTAFPGDANAAFVANALDKGMTMEQAKDARMAALEAENAKLRSTAKPAAKDDPDDDEPEEEPKTAATVKKPGVPAREQSGNAGSPQAESLDDEVRSIQTANPNLTRKQAVAHAIKTRPDLHAAYVKQSNAAGK